jgi:threonine synthase
MRFLSTRGQTPALELLSDAVATGLCAPDGGLFLPETAAPDFSAADLAPLRAVELPGAVFRVSAPVFATDIPADTRCGRSIDTVATRRFDHHREIAPLVPLCRRTCSCSSCSTARRSRSRISRCNCSAISTSTSARCGARRINVLGATSGDTGAAAIHGLLGKPGTAIFILYPDGRRLAAAGTPDGLHRGGQCASRSRSTAPLTMPRRLVKEIFADQAFRTQAPAVRGQFDQPGPRACAVRVLPVRLAAACRGDRRNDAEFVVPTGNFGNVLAGWMLQKMGVPIRGFQGRDESERHSPPSLHHRRVPGGDRVSRAWRRRWTSRWRRISSGFIYYSVGQDGSRVRTIMEKFKASGHHRFDPWDRSTLTASRCTDAEIAGLIGHVHRTWGYVADPHTACGFKDLAVGRPSVVLATASPAKFPETLRTVLGFEPTHPSLERLKGSPLVKHLLPARTEAVRAFVQARAV